MQEQQGKNVCECPVPMEVSAKDQRRRVALLVVTSIYTFVFVGAFFGWGPMQLMVRRSMEYMLSIKNCTRF